MLPLKREYTKVLLSRKLKKINFDTHLLTLLLRLLFNMRWKYWCLYLQIVLKLVPVKMDHSLYHITHQAASILIKCTNLLVKNMSTKPNEKLKSQQTWGIFVILHQSYFLQHCDRFAKCMCVGRRSRCALPANGVYQELQCGSLFLET